MTFNMRKYDTHVHFDRKLEHPYAGLKKKLIDNNIERCVLILNSIQEEDLFWYESRESCKDGIIARVAAILDINDKRTGDFFDKAKYLDMNVVIKLHPRLTNITCDDFEQVFHFVKSMENKEIIIDDFIYGPDMKNHVGTELAIYLAKRLPDRKIILAHAGGCEILKTFLITKPLQNIYYDYSLTCNYLEHTSIYQDMVNGLVYQSERIMFGTDYPDFDFSDSVRAMTKLCEEAGLTKEQMEGVFFENANRIYGKVY